MMHAGNQFREPARLRRTMHSSELASVENACVPAWLPPPSGYETGYQVVLSYSGLFAYNVGRRRWLIDANRTLCISPGWEFFDEHPVPGVGHAALLINPAADLVHEVCGPLGPDRHSPFMRASVPNTTRLQMLTHNFLQAEDHDPLRSDEWTICALQELAGAPRTASRGSGVVDRAKEVLHAYSCERLTLSEVAALVGVSPAYLTQEFSRSEGVPLYQYQLRLRLSRSLLELRHCDDITGLALDLGFSSHSHFTSLFHRSFGLTPSQYRSGTPADLTRPSLKAASMARRFRVS